MNDIRRILIAALLLAAAACADGVGPRADAPAAGTLSAKRDGGGSAVLRDVLQSRLAPSLTAYRLDFWAVKGQDRVAEVRYADGMPFLRFAVPAAALSRLPDGRRIARGDSVLISLAIDPVKFRVKFDPSGLTFDSSSPATLAVWYGYADADFDQNGILSGTDLMLRSELSFWSQQADTDPWSPVASSNDPLLSWIQTQVPHFSGYAVSW